MHTIKNSMFLLLLMLIVVPKSHSSDIASERLLKEYASLKEKENSETGIKPKTGKKNVDESTSPLTRIDCGELSDPILVSLGYLGDNKVECGQMTVPADWSGMNDDTIKLAVYRIPSLSPTPAPDPVVFLAGGPGQAGVIAVKDFSTGPLTYLRGRSDVIVIDQRGTGYSQPNLYCPEVIKASAETSDISDAIPKYQACHDRLVGEGVRFADYNSAYNAKDVNAVREALGYAEWNLYGSSYGTRLALTTMRDLPEGIRSVVLDSVFPLEVNSMGAASPYVGYRTIEQIASNCAADVDCSANIGDIKTLIEDGIVRLSIAPLGNFAIATLYVQALGELMPHPQLATWISTIATGTDAEAITAGGEMYALVVGNTYNPDRDPVVYPLTGESAVAMQFSVLCSEEKPFLDMTASPNIAADFRESTQQIINQIGQEQARLCDIYTVPARDEIEIQPVVSSLPTLVLADRTDSRTPPAWSILAANSLDNSQYAEFEKFGHGLLGKDECINQITLDFLNNPDLEADQTCIDSLPRVDYITE